MRIPFDPIRKDEGTNERVCTHLVTDGETSRGAGSMMVVELVDGV